MIVTSKNLAFAIPTFRRPELLVQALQSVLDDFGDVSFPKLIVAENDLTERAGLLASKNWAEKNQLEEMIQVIEVQSRGLSSVRNAALAAAFSDPDIEYVAMFDDDSRLQTGWFAAVKKAVEACSADIYGGPTRYMFSAETTPDVKTSPIFSIPYQSSGLVVKLRSSNNLVVSRDVFNMFQPNVFDLSFNSSGGEDSHFFERVCLAGLKSFWISDAEVLEDVPLRRASLQWVFERHQLGAVNSARISLMTRGVRGALDQIVLIVKEFLSSIYWLCLLRSRYVLTAKYRFIGALGRIRGLFGGVQTRS